MPGTRKVRFYLVLTTALIAILALSCKQSLNVGGNKPSQPTNLVASAGDGQVILSWDASTDATSYTVYFAAGATVSATVNDGTKNAGIAVTATVSGLANGTQYAFGVTSANENGTSALSGVQVATPNALAGKPVVTLTPVDSALILSWPTIPGATSYNIYYKSGIGVTTTDYSAKITTAVVVDVGGNKQYNLSSLLNGTTYSVIVTAVNSGGEGAPSVAASSSPGAGNISLVPGNASIRVDWGKSNGASAYTVYWAAGTTVDKTSPNHASVSDPTVTYTITGLANWTQYAVVLTSTSAGGESSAGNVATTTPGIVPATPSLSVAAHPTDGSKLVLSTFSSPHADNYMISWTPSTAGSPVTVASSPYTIGGLGVNTAYTVYVVANNSFGASTAASAAQTTGGPPAAPNVPTLTPSATTTLDVSWTAGLGPAPTGYSIYYATGTVSTSSSFVSSAGTSTSITGLVHGQTYNVMVNATNAYGTSSTSAVASKLLDRAPTLPSLNPSPADNATPSQPASTAFALSWTAATDPDSDGITYDVYLDDGAGNFAKVGTALGSPSASVSATGTPKTYAWYVVAKDTYGATVTSTTSHFKTIAPPTAPGTPTLTPNASVGTSMDVGWGASSGTGTITYTLYYGIGSVSTGSPNVSSISGTSQTVTSLVHSNTYFMMLTASTVYGTSSPGGIASKLLNHAPAFSAFSSNPGNGAAPAGSTAIPASSSFGLSWSAATDLDAGDAAGIKYDLYFIAGTGTPTLSQSNLSGTSTTVNAGTNLLTYTWKVVAKDTTGATADSGNLTFRTGQPAPTPADLLIDGYGWLDWKWNGNSQNSSGSSQYFYVSISYIDGGGYPQILSHQVTIGNGGDYNDNFVGGAPTTNQTGTIYLCNSGGVRLSDDYSF